MQQMDSLLGKEAALALAGIETGSATGGSTGTVTVDGVVACSVTRSVIGGLLIVVECCEIAVKGYYSCKKVCSSLLKKAMVKKDKKHVQLVVMHLLK